VVQAPEPTWYSPPMTLIVVATLMPVTAMESDIMSVLKTTLVWSAKLKKSGVVSCGAACVVRLKIDPLMVPALFEAAAR